MIRRAGIADTVEIRALMESVAGFWDETWRPDVLGRALTCPDTIALVHQDGDAIDGFVCAHDLGFRAYFERARRVTPGAASRYWLAASLGG
jgi:hypothetical protein